MIPVAGSIRSSVPVPYAYSEPSALASEAWLNVCWSISSAPQGPPAMCVARRDLLGSRMTSVTARRTPGPTRLEDEVGVPPTAAGGLWCELASTAMPALAPAMTTMAAAARTGAKARLRARLPRRGPGLPGPGLTTEPGLADQAIRDLLDGYPARRLGSDPVQHVG